MAGGKKVLILGGGASGLSVAWRLGELGIAAEVIEAASDIGGLAATRKFNGYYLDYGPHYFISERQDIVEKVTSLFQEDFGEEMTALQRDVKLLFHGRFLNYPITAKNILTQIPFKDSLLSGLSYLYRQGIEKAKKPFVRESSEENFEQWARKNFGDYLFKLFFKPYTEQFWGMPCEKLSPRCMPTHTKLSFFKTLKLVFQRKAAKENASLVERETTLLLRYPYQGIGMIMDAVCRRVESLGGVVHTGYKVSRIARQEGGYTVTAAREGKQRQFTGNFVVSTIPIGEMISMLSPAAPAEVMESATHIDFLCLIVVYMVTRKQNIFDSSYLYFLGRPYNRVSETNKFSKRISPPGENMLAAEISCRADSSTWKLSDEQLFEMCIASLEKDGFLKKSETIKYFVLRARHAYPIYALGYERHFQALLEYMETLQNFAALGRTGKLMYADIDQCMVKGFELAEEIAGKLG
ncbi:FAD-dependent oxidoreductase [Candidatus Woesearchaeota archaeon]|nr:FAD-dependent oxidoreductase [Candidatus Woesearchaeota archaeon]